MLKHRKAILAQLEIESKVDNKLPQKAEALVEKVVVAQKEVVAAVFAAPQKEVVVEPVKVEEPEVKEQVPVVKPGLVFMDEPKQAEEPKLEVKELVLDQQLEAADDSSTSKLGKKKKSGV